eukprot:CAMPEP_0174230746 /NCGR_PEP_ID=MMETSP0417-20130205/1442_1 /TAXON_ID=242541 /ORGANISM="Mayorella sp, Strain BSH-02190019" /LENGTH=363 /DNA_ID=CAMNT_0015308503 /DNA_START=24 /DNA_END=1115 /DNA_ORIENTATION=-
MNKEKVAFGLDELEEVSVAVALGGHALRREGCAETYAEQKLAARTVLGDVLRALGALRKVRLLVTHGNGPQVGTGLQRSELGVQHAALAPVPLHACVAESQGGIGFSLESALRELLAAMPARRAGLSAGTQVATVLTTVLVDAQHAEFREPSKPVGGCMDAATAERMRTERGWVMRETLSGWRRVVPSPPPHAVQQAAVVRTLLDAGVVVVAAGGGGIPVCVEKVCSAGSPDGTVTSTAAVDEQVDDRGVECVVGVDAVVDKDRATALLAGQVDAKVMAVLTPVDGAFIHYGTEKQTMVGRVTVSELEQLLERGHFPKGSMGPKVESAIAFVRGGGSLAIITRPSLFADALADRAGTRVIPDC